MLKKHAIFAAMILMAVLFAWLGHCATCTIPTVTTSEWQVPPNPAIGTLFQMEIQAYGGLTPPQETLFKFHTLNNVDCTSLFAWKPAGLCKHGIIWQSRLKAWPIDIGTIHGTIATYLPQKLKIQIPETTIAPRNNIAALWTKDTPSTTIADAALAVTAIFTLSAFATLSIKKRRTIQLNAKLVARLQRTQHPAFLLASEIYHRNFIDKFANSSISATHFIHLKKLL